MKFYYPNVFRKYNLLDHPFYLAWNEGKLSREQLSLYAQQYGLFIQLISSGWHAANEEGIALEENEHYILWQKFGKSLNGENKNIFVPAVEELVNSTTENYKNYASALGALYAFEVQQPGTATSKLAGLQKHYGKWNVDETYFKIHADDIEEPELLEEKINDLSPQDKLIAAQACETTCGLLWNALTEIYENTEVSRMN
jgi:pyrroloquinoline-quinone synthase